MKQTIFLVAGCPSTDIHAAQFMRKMRSINPSKNYQFVGIGGPEMQKEGFEAVLHKQPQFLYKPFFPWKNFKWIFIEAYTHPVHTLTHLVNLRMMRQLRPHFDEILEMKPSAFVTFENQFFMKFFYREIKEHSLKNNQISAPSFFWGLTYANELHHHQQWLDHFFTRLPTKPSLWSKFQFPSTQVGWDGLFRAYRFLFSRSDKYKALTAQEDHLFLPSEHHQFPLSHLISDLVQSEREQFRTQNNIGEQDTLLFLATGNTKHEILWCIRRTKAAIDQLFKLKEMTNIPKESFALVISVPPQEDLNQIALQEIQKINWPIKMIIVSLEDDKFASMSASDIGLAVNGQIVAECAGLQLPTIVLDAEPFLKSYYRSLWNSFCLDLNIAVKGIAYPELLGSSIPMKIALTIQELYSNPKLRFQYVERYEEILRQSLSPSSMNPSAQQSQAFQETELVGYKSGVTAMAETVAKAADVYDQLDQQTPAHKHHEVRVQAMKKLGWAKGVY